MILPNIYLNIQKFGINNPYFFYKNWKTTTTQTYHLITSLAQTYFNSIQSLFMFSYGSRELFWDSIVKSKQVRFAKINVAKKEIADRIHDFVRKFLKIAEKETYPINYYTLHGSLFFSAGVSGCAAALHRLEKINLRNTVNYLEIFSSGAFFLANLASLRYNVKIYRDASQLLAQNAAEHIKKSVDLLKNSAVLGILSNLHYLMIPAIPLLGFSVAVALVFGCIAAFTGGLKILYDFLYLNS